MCKHWGSFLSHCIWKTGGKFIVHFFQAISHISDLIESEQLHYFLLVKLKESNYSQLESEQHNMFSVPGSLMIFHPMANSGWVTAQFIHRHLSMSHPMTNREWVTLLYFFARQSHQSCLIPWPTASEWHCFISWPGCVSSIMSHPMTNREWVTLVPLITSDPSFVMNRLWVAVPLVSAQQSHYIWTHQQ